MYSITNREINLTSEELNYLKQEIDKPEDSPKDQKFRNLITVLANKQFTNQATEYELELYYWYYWGNARSWHETDLNLYRIHPEDVGAYDLIQAVNDEAAWYYIRNYFSYYKNNPDNLQYLFVTKLLTQSEKDWKRADKF